MAMVMDLERKKVLDGIIFAGAPSDSASSSDWNENVAMAFFMT